MYEHEENHKGNTVDTKCDDLKLITEIFQD